jgi:hypothetical protein
MKLEGKRHFNSTRPSTIFLFDVAQRPAATNRRQQ